MSRVGRKPVELPKGVEAAATGNVVKVKGPKGELSMTLNPQVEVKIADGKAQVATRSTSRTARVVSGTTRAILANMVTGVSKGFERKLELDTTAEATPLTEAQAQAYLGDLMLHSNRKDAEEYLQRALKLDPNLGMANGSLGMLRFLEG